jgi:tetratricopeptide (TPR) repeat protein
MMRAFSSRFAWEGVAMFAAVRSKLLFVLCLFFLSSTAWAQLCTVFGDVKGPDGLPYKGAVIKFTRTDASGTYTVKTDKKGHFSHGGLPFGKFKVSLIIDGKEVDHIDNVQTQFATQHEANFDMQKLAQKNAALNQAAQTGQFTKEQKKELTPEERSAFQAQLKQQAELSAKNKALKDAFAAGQTALDAKQYDEAIAQFSKAAEMAPTQAAVWIYLAEAYVDLGDSKTGADRQDPYTKGCDNFQKAIALKPDDAVMHRKYAQTLSKLNKPAEAQAEWEKAATLDPANAAKDYYNIGSMLTNLGQADAALAEFKKAIDTDPGLADAQFQYAISLSAKMPPPGPDGKVIAPPGMKEALDKYLQLQPNGPNADAAKNLLALLGSSLQTTYESGKKKKN